MKRIFLMAALPLALAACGGGNEAAADATADAEAPATTDAAEGATETAAADAAPLPVTGRPGRCRIESIKGDQVYEGACNIDEPGGASLIIGNSPNGSFVDGVTEFSIEADTPTVASMSARTADGEMTSLGVANKEGNCWRAEEMVVCTLD